MDGERPNAARAPQIAIDSKEAHAAFIAKLLNPFTPIEELKDLFMKPIPPNVGMI